jgi:hypothetical protein
MGRFALVGAGIFTAWFFFGQIHATHITLFSPLGINVSPLMLIMGAACYLGMKLTG